ncbi:VanZ family protein [Argonema antarcticum]|uniref:VanZ family protein n=1 Tax=Argonema antarcticum TaxID=2942763 RepID=UPI002013A920|nr:VanZ family protein [Argonema antarcticum]MCL1473740.1 VanZ family protein [Argonema antarcticum A004/B2]
MNFSWLKSSKKGWIFAFWFYFAVLITISISAYLKVLPVKSSTIPYYDTIGHFILLGMAAFFGHLALSKRKISVWSISIPLAPLLVAICCIADELLQTLSPNRSASFYDLAADWVGIAIFYLLAERVKLKKSLGEEKL